MFEGSGEKSEAPAGYALRTCRQNPSELDPGILPGRKLWDAKIPSPGIWSVDLHFGTTYKAIAYGSTRNCIMYVFVFHGYHPNGSGVWSIL